MVCVDSSANSEAALKFYVDKFYRDDSQIVVLHISDDIRLPGVSTGASVGMPEAIKAAVDDVRRSNKQLYDKFEAQCKAMEVKYKVVILENTQGSVGASIRKQR